MSPRNFFAGEAGLIEPGLLELIWLYRELSEEET